MKAGCAVIFVIFLVLLFFSALATVPEHGIYALIFAGIIGYLLYIIFRPVVKKDKINETTRTSAIIDKKATQSDNLLPIVISTKLVHTMMSENSEDELAGDKNDIDYEIHDRNAENDWNDDIDAGDSGW